MTAPCNCYYGEDCTRTTVCANESVVQDLEERIAELEALIAILSSEHGDMNEANVRYEKRIADLESELEEWKDSCDPGIDKALANSEGENNE